MNQRKLIRFLLCAAGLLVFGAIEARAQSASSGSVAGLVTDQQNALVAGAEVRLIDSHTNTSLTTTTNDQGRYSFASVLAVYVIIASKAGFSSARITGKAVEVGLALNVNIAASGLDYDDCRSPSGCGRGAANLECDGRLNHFRSINAHAAELLAGCVLAFGVASGRGADRQCGGAASDQNVFQLDGGSNSDDMSGNQNTYVPGNGYAGTASSGGLPWA